jgi:ribose transport system ATP-binding protein
MTVAPVTPIALRLRGISKVYPGVVALRDVSLSVDGGEIVGLIGENGAGKSTLMKILGGTVAPNAGTMEIDGEPVADLNPATAAARGIAFVHQELNPFTNLDVAGNVLLGREPCRGPFRTLDRAAMARTVQPILTLLGARFGPGDPMARLALADQQLVEIARALSMNARLVIFDEPTSSLTFSETERLLQVMRDLRARGVAVLFISHRLSEIAEVADRVVVLRDGRNAGELTGAGIVRDRMVRLMIGRDISKFYVQAQGAAGAPLLDLRGLRTLAYPAAAVDLGLRAGEILGIAGLVGAGRTELARAVFGIDPVVAGEMRLDGIPLPSGSVAARSRAGSASCRRTARNRGSFSTSRSPRTSRLPSLGRAVAGALRRPRGRDAPRRDLARPARHPGAGARPGGRGAVRGQPAEGGAGEMAGDPAAPDHPRRADPRHRRGREGRDLPADAQPRVRRAWAS